MYKKKHGMARYVRTFRYFCSHCLNTFQNSVAGTNAKHNHRKILTLPEQEKVAVREHANMFLRLSSMIIYIYVPIHIQLLSF